MSENFFEVKSPLGKLIVCSTATWENHIKTGHQIMSGNADKVIETLQDPLIVYESNENASRDVYFGISTYTISDKHAAELFTKVIVQNESAFSNVVSAWPQKEIKGGINEGVIKHVKPKL